MKHREALREIVQTIVLERSDKRAAFSHIAAWAEMNVEANEQDEFKEVAESEVVGLHEGSFARHQIRLSQFKAWQDAWNKPGKCQAAARKHD